MNIKSVNKKKLIALARKSIDYYFDNRQQYLPDESEYSDPLFKKSKGVFVTIKKDDKLRGCIGNLLPFDSMVNLVALNATKAAFQDPRFQELKPDEFDEIKIEISLLSKPEPLEYEDNEQLLDFLKNEKPGVIISLGYFRSTFLPQVWEDLSDPEEFLSHLSQKAGLAASAWKNHTDVEIETYQVDKIVEE